MARLVVTRAPDIVMGPGAEVQIQSDAVPPPATSPAVTFYIRTHSEQHFPSPCRLSGGPAATTRCVELSRQFSKYMEVAYTKAFSLLKGANNLRKL